MSSIVIRVDNEIYEIVMARKHELERERGEVISLNDALRDLLHLQGEEEDHG